MAPKPVPLRCTRPNFFINLLLQQRIRDEIDEVLERFRMTRRLPGMEVMILKDGEEFYRQGIVEQDGGRLEIWKPFRTII